MGSIFLRNNSYVIEYRDRGKVKRETIGKKGIVTKSMAREVLKQRESDVKLGKYGMLDNEIPTLLEFSKDYMKYVRDTVKKRSWKRDELCLRHLNAFFGDRELSRITPKDIDDYKSFRLSRVTAATTNRELEVFRYLFNLAERWERFFGKNPVSKAGLLPLNNQMERILSYEEQERLLEASPGYFKGIILCALNSGMRKTEIITLKWSNVDLINNVITLEQQNTKSNKMRRIPVNTVLRKLLLEQRLVSSGSEFVFLNSAGLPYKRQDSLNRIWKRVTEQAGITGLRFHDLRHTTATRMLENTGNLFAVSRILGHSSVSVTSRYLHPDNSLVEATESLTKNSVSNPVTDKSTDIQG